MRRERGGGQRLRRRQRQNPPIGPEEQGFTFALAGNQNSGKTTLFNQLTGARQHVGNFPGVTVDQKVGDILRLKGAHLVDLPGIYSVRPYTSEELITRDYILNQRPDALINIVDATNIQRNLYLTLQLLEMRIPTVLALNMMDEVRANGGHIDVEALSEGLGIPVVPISASRNEGLEELLHQARRVAEERILPQRMDFCGPGPVHRCIHAVSHVIEDHADQHRFPSRFAATKLIEGDDALACRLGLDDNERELIEHSVVEMETECGMDRNEALADMRYSFIQELCERSVRYGEQNRERRRSEAIDRLLTHRVLAIPVFFAIMLVIFYLTFNVVCAWLSDLLAQGIDGVAAAVDHALTDFGLNPVVHSLIIDGAFAGVGSVLSFLPLIVVLFFFLSVLEDTGYMARIAFVMDKPLRRIGLSGRSIVPMLIGFGCTVPAILSTRTLSSARDRRMTILLTPFMSCSAKIPIYAVFAAAFFGGNSALVMLVLYLLGVALGIGMAHLGNHTLFKGTSAPFVLELPNYRFPSLKSVAILLWEKARDFITRAFTVIFLATLVVWFLQSFDLRMNPVTDSADSLLAGLGRLLTPLFAPLGVRDWRLTTALVSGLTAKEAVVSTLGVLLAVPMAELPVALQGLFTPLSAASYLVFVLLYTPCVAAIATMKKELESGWATLVAVIGQCLFAWLVAWLVYLLGGLVV
ncbi:MAG: ferrous iron transport protein B [Clostridiales bacterium]|nr:ferrous iron transport protein B [Clostridiales bacterium]